MSFTNEMIDKAKKAKSADELLEMAKAEGVELSVPEAEQYYAFLSGCRELTDDELQQVAGGKGFSPAEAYIFKNGDCFLDNNNTTIFVYIGTEISCLPDRQLKCLKYDRFDTNTLEFTCSDCVLLYAYDLANIRYIGTRGTCIYKLIGG